MKANSYGVLDKPVGMPHPEWAASIGLAFGSMIADLACTEPRATQELARVFNETAERFGSPYRLKRTAGVR